MRKILFLSILTMIAAVSISAQAPKVITNADLEKHTQKRLAAEKEYRENYARLGFPSPEALEAEIEKSRVEREHLAARLAAERLEREQRQVSGVTTYFEPVYIESSDAGYVEYFHYPRSVRLPTYFRVPRSKGHFVQAGNGIPLVNYYGVPLRNERPRPVFRTHVRRPR